PLRRTSCNKQKRTSDVLQKPDNLKSYRQPNSAGSCGECAASPSRTASAAIDNFRSRVSAGGWGGSRHATQPE
ncbi:hypothetical protein, partial [Mesorhizobium sp. M0134]|uniref:hypothetical protein n=1 Tax=unclassified Mesorhizobium TaxID=325217 RepID=UPI003334B7C0